MFYKENLKADLTTWVGIVAGVFTGVSLLPQLIKLIRNKKAEDISLFFLGILFFGLCLWIWYGVLKEDVPIIATNSFSLLINSAMIVLGLKYKNKK
jgi:MtN3 and saliva related transmembrane protein